MRYLTAFLLYLVAMPVFALPDFTAWYTAHKGSFRVATSQVSYQQKDRHYTYSSRSKPAGLVSIFRSDLITEASTGSLENGRPKPDSYHYRHAIKKRIKREVRITFQHRKQRAISTYKGQTRVIIIPADALDRFSIQIAVMNDLGNKRLGNNYPIAGKTKLKNYKFVIVGKETVKTDAGTFQTIKLMRKHQGKKRTTYMYCAPSLHYLPVRIEHIKGNGSKFRMDLDKVSGLGN